MMLRIPEDIKIYIATAPVDMRRSFDGLSATVHDVLKQNPLSGHIFVFRGKRGDRVKILVWDRNGFLLVYKRLERGHFKWPRTTMPVLSVTKRDLELLLDGIDFTRLKTLPACHFEAVI